MDSVHPSRLPARYSVQADLLPALRGDSRAIEELIQDIRPVVHARVARVLMRSFHRMGRRPVRQEIEDFVQDVFLCLFEKQAKVLRNWDPDLGLTLKNFVGLVAERQTISILRSGRRSAWLEDPTQDEQLARQTESQGQPLMGSVGTGAEERLISAQLLETMLDRLREELSPKGMFLFDLLYIQELSVEEVCHKTTMSADSVYVWRSRLTRRVHILLSELLSENVA